MATKKTTAAAREVLFAEIAYSSPGDYISADEAKELLGWTEATDETPLEIHNFKVGSRKVFLANNITNRPISKSNYDSLKQEILRYRWMFNGEPIIIGKTGLVLNGQHTLIGLILAAEEYAEWPEGQFWSEEPFIEKLIVYGVDEGDETVNTMDTCKPRSLTDVMYRSAYFQSMKLNGTQKKRVARIADFCIRNLWERTGACFDPFNAAKRTHSESIGFVERHLKLIDCVGFIFEEDTDGNITKWLVPGKCAALLYLMASSKSIFHEYYSDDDVRSESVLDWSMEELAQEFFVLIAARSNKLQHLFEMMAEVDDDERITTEDTVALLIKAWNLFSSGKTVTREKLKLEYKINEDGYQTLIECPTVGGIDLGKPEKPEEEDEPEDDDKTLEEKPTKRKGKHLEGDEVWVQETDDEASRWKGTIKELYPKRAKVSVGNGYAGAGTVIEVSLEHLKSV